LGAVVRSEQERVWGYFFSVKVENAILKRTILWVLFARTNVRTKNVPQITRTGKKKNRYISRLYAVLKSAKGIYALKQEGNEEHYPKRTSPQANIKGHRAHSH